MKTSNIKQLKKKTTPRRVLLDSWHLDVFVRPTKKLTRDDRRVLKLLMTCHLEMVKARIIKDLERKIDVSVSQ